MARSIKFISYQTDGSIIGRMEIVGTGPTFEETLSVYPLRLEVGIDIQLSVFEASPELFCKVEVKSRRLQIAPIAEIQKRLGNVSLEKAQIELDQFKVLAGL